MSSSYVIRWQTQDVRIGRCIALVWLGQYAEFDLDYFVGSRDSFSFATGLFEVI